MNEIRALKNLLALYERPIHVHESWKMRDLYSIECHDVGAKMERGLTLYHRLNCLTEDWNDKKRAEWGNDLISIVIDFFSRWIIQSDKVREIIHRLEAKGFKLHRADEFRERLAIMKLIPLDVQDYQRRFREADEGGLSLDEAFSQLIHPAL